MVLSKRFSKDISSMLPSVEEAKDAEEQQEQEEGAEPSEGGDSSRPPSRPSSRPLASLSRGSVDDKIIQRIATARSGTEEGFSQEIIVVSASTEEAVEKAPEQPFVKKKHEDDFDTDLEIEEDKEKYDPSGKSSYISACQLFGVVPVSYYLRHIGDSELVMRHHGLGAQDVKAIAVSLVTNTSIVKLNLSDNWLEVDGTAALADMLKENCYISELHLCDNRLGLKGAKALSAMLIENITLQKVYLSGNEFDDRSAPFFSDALMNNQKVECMDLSHNMFGDGSGGKLGSAIAENTGILELNLSWNHIRGKGAVAIAKGLGANIFIRVLDLSYNGFGNDGAAALGEALKVNNVLEELNISNNRISLQGAVRFALGLKENKTLKVLKMARNPMQSEGCFAILKSIQANSQSAIESLDFSDIFVNKQFDDLHAVVKTTMPSLTVKLGGNSDMFKKNNSKADQIKKVKQYAKKNNLNLSELFSKPEEQVQMTYEDFKQTLTVAGIIMSEEESQQLICFLDKDKTGFVDFSSFQKALLS